MPSSSFNQPEPPQICAAANFALNPKADIPFIALIRFTYASGS